ncbi:hypothetical protein NQ318_004551 [Aromia moschata]|uniref:Uncharacterized protein n=1 Tax=Aromia moschata TaxID=1265417 RepID=A0AAV8XQ65_9CUCU|nr:hypothetical protein NQ318_004551 [Aromia moschata]
MTEETEEQYPKAIPFLRFTGAATTDMSNLTAIPAPNLPLFQHALDDSPSFCFIAGSFFNTFLHPTDLSLTSATLFSSFEFQSSR